MRMLILVFLMAGCGSAAVVTPSKTAPPPTEPAKFSNFPELKQ